MYLEILTPGKLVFKGDVNLVKVPGSGGSFEMMNKHAPVISALQQGELRIVVDQDTILTYRIDSGVVQMLENKAIILVETIQEITANSSYS